MLLLLHQILSLRFTLQLTEKPVRSGRILGSDERITTIEALKAITINAAYQLQEENRKGSIKEGKLADFVILDQNPITIDPEKIRSIKVLETIKEDIPVYIRK